jgi:hypothetical protein
MNISRRVATTLSGLVLAGAVSAGPALAAADTATSRSAAAPVAAMTNPSDGFCLESERDDVKLGGDNRLYECSYVTGLGWYWLPY